MLSAAVTDERGRFGPLRFALTLALLAAVVLTGTSGTWAPTWLGVGGTVVAVILI